MRHRDPRADATRLRVSYLLSAVVIVLFAASVGIAGITDGAGGGISNGGVGGGIGSPGGPSVPLHFEELGEDTLSSDFTTTSSTLTNITGLAVTFTAEADERVLVTAGIVTNDASGQASLSVTIDGTDPNRGGEQRRTTQALVNGMCVLSQALTEGSVTVQTRCATSAGTLRIDADDGSNAQSWVQVIGVRGDAGTGDLVRLGQDTLASAQTISTTAYTAVTNLSLDVTAEEDERLLVVFAPMTAFELDGATTNHIDLRVEGSTINRAIRDHPQNAGGNSGTNHAIVYLTEPQSAGTVTFQAFAKASLSDTFQVYHLADPGRSHIAVYAIRDGTGSGWSLLAEDDIVSSGDFSTTSTSATAITGLSDSFTANSGEDVIVVGNWIFRHSSSTGTVKIDVDVAGTDSNTGIFNNVQAANLNEYKLTIYAIDGLASGSKTVTADAWIAGSGTGTIESDTGDNGLSGFQVIGVR